MDELNHFSCSKALATAEIAAAGFEYVLDVAKLRDVCDELDDNGVIWMMSNSYADIVLGLLPGTVPYQHSRSVTGHQLQGAQAGEGCGGHRHGLRGDLIIVDLIYISA